MYDINDLKTISMLSHLTDPMLKKISEITTTRKYDAGQYVFKEGDYADFIYSVIEGMVGLEVAKSSTTRVTVSSSTRGMTFGTTALVELENKKYLGYARAIKDTKVFCWRGSDMEKLFYDDYELGFLVMRKLAKILNSRMQSVTSQFADIFG